MRVVSVSAGNYRIKAFYTLLVQKKSFSLGTVSFLNYITFFHS